MLLFIVFNYLIIGICLGVSDYYNEINYIIKIVTANDSSIYPVEFWTLREDNLLSKEKNKSNEALIDDAKESSQTTKGLFKLAEVIEVLSKDKDSFIQILPQGNKEVYKARLDQLILIAELALVMKKDLWHEDYVDNLTKHIIGIRAAGISKKLPKFLWNPRTNQYIVNQEGLLFEQVGYLMPILYDENFRRFGALRSYAPGNKDTEGWLQPSPYQSVYWDLEKYMRKEKADLNFIKAFTEQSMHSLSDKWPLATEMFFMKQRSVPPSNYSFDLEKISGAYEKMWSGSIEKKESLNTAIVIWHAFTQEILNHTRFRHKNEDTKTVRINRTVNLYRVKNIAVSNDKGAYTMPQRVFNSVSIFFPYKFDREYIIMDLPYHRIIGVYFMEKAPGFATAMNLSKSGLFLLDQENEFLSMLEGIPFKMVVNSELDLNGNFELDSYMLNEYYRKKEDLIDDSYARQNLDNMLNEASALGDIDAVRVFLELGADPSAVVDHTSYSMSYLSPTPIAGAIAFNGDNNFEIIKMLILYGADLSYKVGQREPLKNYLELALKYHAQKVAALLVESGIAINEDMFQLAITSGYDDVAQLIRDRLDGERAPLLEN